MNILKFRGALVLGALFAVAVANADAVKTQTKGDGGNDIRVGLFWPSSAGAKAVGANWLSFGFDHKFDKQLLPVGTYAQSLSIDYSAKNDNRTIPVLLNFAITDMDGMSFSVGVGGAVTKIATFSDKIEFAAAATLSYQQKGWPVFLQAKYNFTGKDDFRGFSAFVGYKF